MSQDSQYADAPEYGGAPQSAPTARDEMSAPPQMGPLARLGNIFFSPGDVFEDVRRSPRDWWLPMVVLLIVATAVGYFIQYKLDFTPEKLAAAAVESGLEQQGKTRKDLSADEQSAVAAQEKVMSTMFKLGPITGGGYANAATRKWLRAYVEKYGRVPDEARKSWPYPFVADLLGTVRPLTSQIEMFA